jgi:hypothetical protein
LFCEEWQPNENIQIWHASYSVLRVCSPFKLSYEENSNVGRQTPVVCTVFWWSVWLRTGLSYNIRSGTQKQNTVIPKTTTSCDSEYQNPWN